MKSILAAAVAAVLSVAAVPGHAASSDELAQIREQLQTLIERVDKLEAENEELQAENETLKSQSEYLRAETRGLRKDSATHAAEVAKVKGADWASRVAIKGDLRYRHEYISDPTRAGSSGLDEDNQTRHRVRARLGVEAKVTDTLMVGLQVATGGEDPRSSNQTLGGGSSRKSIGFDLAYFDWKFAPWGDLIGGKMKFPFYRPGQSLFYDGDINPEGLALQFNRGIWFGSTYGFWLEERNNVARSVAASAGPPATAASLTTCIAPPGERCSEDIYIAGGQFGGRFPVGAATLVAGVQYTDLQNGQGQRPFFNAGSTSAQNGNTVVGSPPALLYDYDVAQAFLEFNTLLGTLPLQVWTDVAQNLDADELDTAWAAGVLFGKASGYRTWEFGAAYQVVEKDALFGQYVDSDFADGTTDGKGWILRAGYAPLKNWTVNGTYLNNKRNVDVPNSTYGAETDYERVQLDFNVKF